MFHFGTKGLWPQRAFGTLSVSYFTINFCRDSRNFNGDDVLFSPPPIYLYIIIYSYFNHMGTITKYIIITIRAKDFSRCRK